MNSVIPRILVIACFVLASIDAAQAGDPPVRPNIVFILADDLGKEWISAYGAEDIETPEIDRMAEEGLMLHSAYAMPQCTPTRVSFLTGQLPYNHGWVNHWDVPRWGSGAHFDPEMNNSVANILRDAGYSTAAAGKWQVADFRVNPNAMDDAGFDDWAMWTGFEAGTAPSSRRYWDPYIHPPEGSKTYEGELGPDIYTQYLLDFMEENKGAGEPFFVYYAMALPHTPFVATPDEPDAEGNLAKHKAMTRYIDKLTGKFLDKVREGDFDRPTLVIFTTDNGSTGGIRGTIHGREVSGGKMRMDEITGTAMPYIAWAPGLVPGGRESHQITDEADVLPTFAELAGATIPGGPGREVDGKSIAPLLLGETDETPREGILSMGEGQASFEDGYVVPRVPFRHRVIRDNRWKIWVNHDREVTQLYDIKNDPFEDENLIDSDDPEAQRGLARLERVLDTMPEQDHAPRYRPMPPQPWDRHFGWVDQLEDQQLRQELEQQAGDAANYDLDRDHLRRELRSRNSYDPDRFPERFESPQGGE